MRRTETQILCTKHIKLKNETKIIIPLSSSEAYIQVFDKRELKMDFTTFSRVWYPGTYTQIDHAHV